MIFCLSPYFLPLFRGLLRPLAITSICLWAGLGTSYGQFTPPTGTAGDDTVTAQGTFTGSFNGNGGNDTVTIQSGTTITSDAATAITIESGTVTNRGNIIVNLGGSNQNGIQTTGAGSVLILQNGTLQITGISSLFGINTSGNDVQITNLGAISINGTGSTNYGISGSGLTVDILSNATIDVSGTGSLHGIYGNGITAVTLDHRGNINVQGTGSNIYGISGSGSTVDILSNANIVVSGSDALFGIVGSAGTFTLDHRGDINLQGTGSNNYGIYGSGGIVDILSYATIDVSGTSSLYGIYGSGGTSFTLDHRGNINIQGTGSSNYGIYGSGNTVDILSNATIDVSGTGSLYGVYGGGSTVTLDHRGNINIQGTDNNNYGIYGVGSTVDILSNATIDVSGIGSLYGVYGSGNTVTLDHQGNINIQGTGGNSYGISGSGNTVDILSIATVNVSGTTSLYGVYSSGNNVTLDHQGNINIQGTGGNSYGISGSGSTVDILSYATIDVSGSGSLYGIYGSAGTFTLDHRGNINIQGTDNNNYGIYGSGSTVDILSYATIDVSGSGSLYGIYGSGSTATLDHRGNINLQGTGSSNYGLYGSGSTVDILSYATIDVSGSGSLYGIYGSAGTFTLDHQGNINVQGTGSNIYGIYSSGGTADIHSIATIDVSGANSLYGIYGSAGTFTLDHRGNINLQGTGSGNYGIYGSGSTVDILSYATIDVSGTSSLYGIYGSAGTFTLNHRGDINVQGSSNIAYGIFSSGGTADIHSIANIDVSGTEILYGIYNGAGTQTIDHQGDINVRGTGNIAYGIFSSGGTADIHSIANIDVSGTEILYGIFSSAGTQTIDHRGDINVRGTGNIAYGIFSSGGTADIRSIANIDVSGTEILYGIYGSTGTFTLDHQGNINVRGTGSGNYGIYSSGGTADIHSIANIDVSGTDSLYGIYGSAGTFTLDHQGNINVRGTGSGNYGIYANAGTFSTTNTDTISVTGTSGAGIYFNGGLANITNTGGSISHSTGDAITIIASASELNLNGISRINGLMNATGGSNDTLNLNLLGVTPSDAAVLQTTLATIGSGAGTFTAAGQTYAINGFENFTLQTTSFADILAGTTGLEKFADALDHIGGDVGADFASLLTQFADSPDAPTLFSLLAGQDVLDALNNLSLSQINQLAWDLSQRSQTLRHGSNGIDTTGLRLSDASMLASADAINQQLNGLGLLAQRGQAMSDSPVDQGIRPAPAPNTWGAWVSGNASYAKQDDDAGISGYETVTSGTTLGIDARASRNLAVGILGGYSHNSANLSGNGEIEGDNALAGIYAIYANKGWHGEALAGYVHSDYNIDREWSGNSAKGDTTGHTAALNLSGGYDFKASGWTFGPSGGIQYAHALIEGYNQSGGPTALQVDDQNIDSFKTIIGFQAGRTVDFGCLILTPRILAQWHHEFLNDDNATSTRFINAPAVGSFSVNNREPERDYALVGANIAAEVPDWENVSFFLGYNAQVGQDSYISHYADAGLRVSF